MIDHNFNRFVFDSSDSYCTKDIVYSDYLMSLYKQYSSDDKLLLDLVFSCVKQRNFLELLKIFTVDEIKTPQMIPFIGALSIYLVERSGKSVFIWDVINTSSIVIFLEQLLHELYLDSGYKMKHFSKIDNFSESFIRVFFSTFMANAMKDSELFAIISYEFISRVLSFAKDMDSYFVELNMSFAHYCSPSQIKE